MISRRGIEVLRHRGRVRRVGVRERVAPRLGLLLSLGAEWPRQPRKLGNLQGCVAYLHEWGEYAILLAVG